MQESFFFFDCFSCYNNLFLNLLLSRFLCSFFFVFLFFLTVQPSFFFLIYEMHYHFMSPLNIWI